MTALRCADPVRQDRARVFEAWRSDLDIDADYTAPELAELAEDRHSYDGSPKRPALHAVLIEIAQKRGAPAGQLDPRRLGKWLSKHENTIASELKLKADHSDERRVRYGLREARP